MTITDNMLRKTKNFIEHNHDSAEATYKLLLFEHQIKMNVMHSTDPLKKQFDDLLKRYVRHTIILKLYIHFEPICIAAVTIRV